MQYVNQYPEGKVLNNIRFMRNENESLDSNHVSAVKIPEVSPWWKGLKEAAESGIGGQPNPPQRCEEEGAPCAVVTMRQAGRWGEMQGDNMTEQVSGSHLQAGFVAGGQGRMCDVCGGK